MTRKPPLLQNPVEGLAAAVLITCFVVACAYTFRNGSAADFRALWLAGQFLAERQPSLVYPDDITFFSMLPPQEWVDRLLAQDYSGEVYPFIYPPIWAWLSAQATRYMTFETLMDWVAVINPVLLVVTLVAARAIAAPQMRLWSYLGLGFLLLYLTPTGLVALHQSQPQILVACLTVLAVERAEHRRPYLAGVLLAVAAAIKLYPALYVLFWLASGQRRAAGAFVVTGGVLAALSVWLSGWQLHLDFLHMVRLISDTALVTRQSFALENLVAQLCCFEDLQLVAAPPTDPLVANGLGWYVLIKPPFFGLIFKLAQVFAILWLCLLFRQSASSEERGALWPFAFALLSLLGPIAWSYHFLSSLAFGPILVARFRPTKGLALLAVFIIAGSSAPFHLMRALFDDLQLVQVGGTLTMIGMATVFYLAARPRQV